MSDLLDTLKEICPLEEDVSLKQMTTLHIGGIAKYVVYPENTVALDSIVRIAKRENIPFKVLGKGSNLLCSDDVFDGIIIRLDRFDDCYYDGETITAHAGCSIIATAYGALKHSLTGLEFASGIPATVGGVTYMNAGAYKSSMSDVIESVFVYRDEVFEWMDAKDCEFAYRTSIFQSHPDWIIIAVRMKLKKGDEEEIRALMDSRRERRMSTQPLDKPSAGSVFRNPENALAWQLIDGIGYRGFEKGDAKVSDKHPNFIINNGNASGKDFLDLCNEIIAKVYDKYQVELHMEVEKFNW